MQKSYTSEGFILSKIDYGEGDKIISIFSKDFGKLSLIAKGVKRMKSKKRGHLEIFNRIKFHAISGKNLDLLVEAQTLDDFAQVRTNLKRISLAYYVTEMISKITHENEPNLEIYRHVDYTLQKLKFTNLLKKLRENFILDTLVILGFWPENQKIVNYDEVVNNVMERKINSLRVGKIISS